MDAAGFDTNPDALMVYIWALLAIPGLGVRSLVEIKQLLRQLSTYTRSCWRAFHDYCSGFGDESGKKANLTRVATSSN